MSERRFEGLDLLPLGLVRRNRLHHLDLAAVLSNTDCSYHSFVGRSNPGLRSVLIVDDYCEVQVCRHSGCSDKNCFSTLNRVVVVRRTGCHVIS